MLFKAVSFPSICKKGRVLNQFLTIYATLGSQVFLETERLIKFVGGMRFFCQEAQVNKFHKTLPGY